MVLTAALRSSVPTRPLYLTLLLTVVCICFLWNPWLLSQHISCFETGWFDSLCSRGCPWTPDPPPPPEFWLCGMLPGPTSCTLLREPSSFVHNHLKGGAHRSFWIFLLLTSTLRTVNTTEAQTPPRKTIMTFAPCCLSSLVLPYWDRGWTAQEVLASHALGYFFLLTTFSCAVYKSLPLLSLLFPSSRLFERTIHVRAPPPSWPLLSPTSGTRMGQRAPVFPKLESKQILSLWSVT